MKKLLKFLPFLLVALMATTFWSCSDDDDDKSISNNELPVAAKTFLSTYYPSIEYRSVKDKTDYDVTLSNGHKVDFNKDGEWEDVDAPMGKTVPTGFYPEAINTYIAASESASGINEISRKPYGFEVELLNGKDLRFDKDGSFIGYDR